MKDAKAQPGGHAFLLPGGTRAKSVALNLLASWGITAFGNADVYLREYQSFGIEDARDYASRASTRALGEGRRVFVILANAMTIEAQNALLKTIEEPAGNALFIIAVPSPGTLLSTLRSRAQELGGQEISGTEDARTFLAANPAARIEIVKELLEKQEGDERDLGAILALLSSLEQLLAPRIAEVGMAESLKAILRARRFAEDKGALLKPLLEQVALLLPAA